MHTHTHMRTDAHMHAYKYAQAHTLTHTHAHTHTHTLACIHQEARLTRGASKLWEPCTLPRPTYFLNEGGLLRLAQQCSGDLTLWV